MLKFFTITLAGLGVNSFEIDSQLLMIFFSEQPYLDSYCNFVSIKFDVSINVYICNNLKSGNYFTEALAFCHILSFKYNFTFV